MGSVIPLKKSANSAYLELKNMLGVKLQKVENLIEQKLKSDVDLIERMSEHHLKSGGKRLRALLTLESAKLTGYKQIKTDAFSMGSKYQFYVLIEYPIGKANKALLNQIKQDEVLSTQKDADKAMAELEAEIEKRKSR